MTRITKASLEKELKQARALIKNSDKNIERLNQDIVMLKRDRQIWRTKYKDLMESNDRFLRSLLEKLCENRKMKLGILSILGILRKKVVVGSVKVSDKANERIRAPSLPQDYVLYRKNFSEKSK